MAYTITGPRIGLPPITDHDTTAKAELGLIVQATDPTYGSGEFIYLKGVASTAVGNAVAYYPDDWSTVRTVATTKGSIAIAMSACVAGEYGWYQIQGKAIATVGTVADNGDVYLTATDGTLDDAVVDGYLVHEARFASANGTPSAGLAEIEIHRPYTDGIATND